MRVLTVKDMRIVEESAKENGISYLQLMENAGSYCARIIRKTYENTNKRKVLVACGKGKNGGDGFVIARKLNEDGFDVTVMVCMGFSSDDESTEMFSRVRAMGIDIVYYDNTQNIDRCFLESDIIVDCIFGIGFYGETDENCKEIFRKINSSNANVISVDVPSGLYGDEGKINPHSVNADVTIAITSLKPVHILKPSCEQCGKIVVAPIGIPEKCFNESLNMLFTLSRNEIKSFIPKREMNSHKGTYGTVLVIGGSYEMPNAVHFASSAAASCGAGLVKVAFPAVAYNAIAPKTFEQVLIPLESNKYGRISKNAISRLKSEIKKCSCVLIGCGMGTDDDTGEVLKFVVENSDVPIIIDADGINCLKGNIQLIDSAKAPVILTPHPKEMSRIAETTVEDIEMNRGAVVKAFTKAHKAVLLLKGASTLVGDSDHESMYVNATGNPGMATGGSGDVLAGMIASFVAQGVPPFMSAICGANIHGRIGDAVSEKYSMMGNTPSLMLKNMPFVLKTFE